MSKIIGQNKLLSTIDKYTSQTLPKTLLFIGAEGCGKHLVSEYIAEKFKFDFVELDNKVSSEALLSFSYRTLNTLYFIDLTAFEEKQQNKLLLSIEEPSITEHFILASSSEALILPTIKNRCVKHYFEPYTKEQLIEITHDNRLTNELAYTIFTPGKLNCLNDKAFQDLCELANKTISNISTLSYGSTVSLIKKFNFKDSYNKIDPGMFLSLVEYFSFERLKQGDQGSFTIFSITNKYRQYFNKKSLIKETLILNYLTDLWEGAHIRQSQA